MEQYIPKDIRTSSVYDNGAVSCTKIIRGVILYLRPKVIKVPGINKPQPLENALKRAHKSFHYIVDEVGSVTTMVHPKSVARHCSGVTGQNHLAFCLSIDFPGSTAELNASNVDELVTENQYKTVAVLLQSLGLRPDQVKQEGVATDWLDHSALEACFNNFQTTPLVKRVLAGG